MSDSSALCSLARSKLHLSIKGECSLHRWVLLKNSVLNSPSLIDGNQSLNQPEYSTYVSDEVDEDDDAPEVLGGTGTTDAFMFPDAGQLVGVSSADIKTSEAQWLDSLLETLGDDDDEDDYVDTENPNSSLPVDDDEFLLYSPTGSPTSSSDDLPNQPDYFSTSISVSYPVPYPPYQPSLIHAYRFDSQFVDPLVSAPAPASYENPFPYHDTDDLEDLPVPDAIDDNSDDESDALATPSLGRSSSSLSLGDAASITLPQERSRLRNANPRVYVDSTDSYFYSFNIDPLPFPDDNVHTSYNHYQEC